MHQDIWTVYFLISKMLSRKYAYFSKVSMDASIDWRFIYFYVQRPIVQCLVDWREIFMKQSVCKCKQINFLVLCVLLCSIYRIIPCDTILLIWIFWTLLQKFTSNISEKIVKINLVCMVKRAIQAWVRMNRKWLEMQCYPYSERRNFLLCLHVERHRLQHLVDGAKAGCAWLFSNLL